ncbi:MAG: aminoglycoside adenylyltransferase domain-containing protein [Terriglobia bacterium]
MELRNFTAYGNISALLAEWVRGVRHILGDKVIGLYLAGSLAYGDFVPGRSDIDLQAVVRNPLTEDEVHLIELLHREIDKRYPEWANRTECSYVPLDLMPEVNPPTTPRPWWGFDTMYPAAPAGNEWTINHFILAKHGISLEGPDFNTLIPPIDIREVRRASAKDLLAEWAPKIDDFSWLSNSHYQSYLVLNLCRILHTAIGSEVGSKKVAGQWAKTTYPRWNDLIEEAERWGYGDVMTRQDDVVAFIRFAIEKVTEANLLP